MNQNRPKFESGDFVAAEPLQHLRRLLEARMGNRGKREFIQVLRLLFPAAIVVASATDAILFERSASTRSSSSSSPKSNADLQTSISVTIPICR